jgi:hypothetical protein
LQISSLFRDSFIHQHGDPNCVCEGESRGYVIKWCRDSVTEQLSEVILEKIIWVGILDYIERDTPMDIEVEKKKRTRREEGLAVNPNALEDSSWGKLLSNDNVGDCTSWAGRTFRRRFRVPYPLYVEVLLPLCIEHDVFDIAGKRIKIRVEFRLLICLRILGRGEVCDTIGELSGVGSSTACAIFKTFIPNFASRCYHLLVYIPTGQQALNIMKRSALLGIPGMFSSVDVTHLFWEKCPSHLTASAS